MFVIWSWTPIKKKWPCVGRVGKRRCPWCNGYLQRDPLGCPRLQLANLFTTFIISRIWMINFSKMFSTNADLIKLSFISKMGWKLLYSQSQSIMKDKHFTMTCRFCWVTAAYEHNDVRRKCERKRLLMLPQVMPDHSRERRFQVF